MEVTGDQFKLRTRAIYIYKEDIYLESSQQTSSEATESLLSSSPDDDTPPHTTVVRTNKNAPIAKPIKKRPLLRKEIQRRYRERQKLKKQLASGSASQIEEDLAILLEENNSMQEELRALLVSLHQADLITSFLKNCRLSNIAATDSASASAEIHFPFSPNNPNEVADALFNNAMHGYEPSEYLIRQYAALPPSILVERDRHHFPLVLDTLMAEWQSIYSTRDEVTLKLKQLFNTRRRISIIIAEESPVKHKELMSKAIQPPPGSACGDLATKALERVSSEINLNGQQLESIKEAWLEYVYAIETLNFDVSMARLTTDGLNQPPAIDAPGGGVGGGAMEATATAPTLTDAPPTTVNSTVQKQCAEDFLNLSANVAMLSQSSRRMSIAYTRLAAVVLSTLDVIQLARLFRGCRPHFPDQVQLCKLIIENQ